jgi:hypothetical protein
LEIMRRIVLSFGLAVAVFWSAACFGGGAPVDTVAPVQSSALLLQTDRLGIGDSVRIVVRDQNRWDEVWSQATSNEPAARLDRPVDFATEMVLVAAAGRMDTGAQIRIDSVGVRGEELVATVVTTRDCRSFASDVYPLVMVRVTATEQRVRWIERRESTARCR